MMNNPYMYNTQQSVDRINTQINELEKIREQLQKPVQPITQNFQLAPTNRETIKYASSIEEVKRDTVTGDTPYFSKDMSVVWLKNIKGETKTLSQWSRKYKISVTTIYDRLKRGWTLEQAFTISTKGTQRKVK